MVDKTKSKKPIKTDNRSLTAEEQAIMNQTLRMEKREEQTPKVGMMLSGGIDSAVTLATVKKMSNRDVQPILITSNETNNKNVNKAVKDILEHQGITLEPKSFDDLTKSTKKEILEYCFDNNIDPLCFGTNYEDSLNNKTANDMLEWRNLSSELNDNAVKIYEPHRGTPKSEMIRLAKELGVLEKTVNMSQTKEQNKLRENAFAEANRQILDAKDFIEDHTLIETESEDEGKGDVSGGTGSGNRTGTDIPTTKD